MVVDLGCGAGVWLEAALRAGYRTAGCDQSRSLVALARKAVPASAIAVASVDAYRIPVCQAVTSLGEVLGYRAPAGAVAGLQRIARRAWTSLSLGGLFLFDVMVTARGNPLSYRTWTAGPDWAVLSVVREEAGGRGLVREITTFRKIGARYRRSDETHRVTLFDPREVAAALREAGFSVRVRRGYGRDRLPSRRLAFIARKTRR